MAKVSEPLQSLCRSYLMRLRHMGAKHGIDVDGIIRANRNGECAATRHEVELLSRACDDERVSRRDIPDIVGKSYRQCVADGDFDGIRRLRRVGIYSKISALLYKNRSHGD